MSGAHEALLVRSARSENVAFPHWTQPAVPRTKAPWPAQADFTAMDVHVASLPGR